VSTSTDLGGTVYEVKRASKRLFFLWGPLAALLGAGGAYALNTPVPNVTLAGALFAATGVLLLCPLLPLPGHVLRFHERGLVETEPLMKPRVLPYEDVERLKWKIVQPEVGLTILAEISGAGRRIAFWVRLLSSGSSARVDLDRVRERIAQYIAARARPRIEANQPFAWGPDRGARARLRREGIAYRPMRFVGPGEEQVVPWTAPLELAFSNGTCHVLSAGREKPLFSLECDGPNFYPGLELFTSMAKGPPRG
jgi:hypothetical protein